MAESQDGSRMDLETPYEKKTSPEIIVIKKFVSYLYEPITISLCYFKSLEFPSLTAKATSVILLNTQDLNLTLQQDLGRKST